MSLATRRGQTFLLTLIVLTVNLWAGDNPAAGGISTSREARRRARGRHVELDPVDRTDEVVAVTGIPTPGRGWFFLITAEDATGEEGTLGFGASAERSNFSPCP